MARPPHPKHRRPRPTGTDRHRVRPFLLGGTFLLALVGLLLLPLLGDGEPLSPGSLARDELAAVPRATEASPAATHAESTAAGDDSKRSTAAVEASATKNAARPFAPRDHLLVRVVDDATGEPIAGAEVAASLDRDEPVPAAELRRQQAIADPFERLRAGGQTATSDPQGYAVLRGSHWMRVMARHGDLFASETIELETVGPDGFLLRLRSMPSTELRVTNQARAPLAGVPLAMMVTYERPGTTSTENAVSSLGRTDADGRLRIRLAQHLRPHDTAGQIEVFVQAPGLTKTRARIENRSASTELVLPAHGRVVIQVVGSDGELVADEPNWSVQLAAIEDTTEPSASSQGSCWDLGMAGAVEFPYVGLGLALAVTANLCDPELTEQRPGPLRDGECVRHRLTVPHAHHGQLRGRLVDELGQPWPNTGIVAERNDRRIWSSHTSTGPDGRFRLRIAAGPSAAPIRLRAHDDNGPLGRTVAVEVTPGRDQDLGDILLPRGEILARGTIREERPTPPGFALNVQCLRGEHWQSSPDYRVQIQDGSSFTIHGRADRTAARLRLCVAAPGCETIAPIEFTPGSTLELVLRPGLAIHASILVRRDWFRILIDECWAVLTNEHGDEHYLTGRIVDDAWHVDFHGARPGRYRLAIQGDTVLAAIDGIVLAAGSPPDPRLEPWDLRDQLQLLHVHAVDGMGRPVRVGGDVSRRDEQGAWVSCGWFDEGIASSLLPNRPFDLVGSFTSGGYATVANAIGSTQMIVPTPQAVTITLQGMPELVPDAPIEVDVVVAEAALSARNLPDVRLVGPVTWRRQQHTLSFELFAPAAGSVRFLRRGQDDQHEVLEQLPCALSAGAAIVLTVPDSLRERLQPWTQPR